MSPAYTRRVEHVHLRVRMYIYLYYTYDGNNTSAAAAVVQPLRDDGVVIIVITPRNPVRAVRRRGGVALLVRRRLGGAPLAVARGRSAGEGRGARHSSPGRFGLNASARALCCTTPPPDRGNP